MGSQPFGHTGHNQECLCKREWELSWNWRKKIECYFQLKELQGVVCFAISVFNRPGVTSSVVFPHIPVHFCIQAFLRPFIVNVNCWPHVGINLADEQCTTVPDAVFEGRKDVIWGNVSSPFVALNSLIAVMWFPLLTTWKDERLKTVAVFFYASQIIPVKNYFVILICNQIVNCYLM